MTSPRQLAIRFLSEPIAPRIPILALGVGAATALSGFGLRAGFILAFAIIAVVSALQIVRPPAEQAGRGSWIGPAAWTATSVIAVWLLAS